MTPHPGEGGDTRVKAIKSDSDSDSDEEKRSPSFSGKNRGVTPSVAAFTHPSDATARARLACRRVGGRPYDSRRLAAEDSVSECVASRRDD